MENAIYYENVIVRSITVKFVTIYLINKKVLLENDSWFDSAF